MNDLEVGAVHVGLYAVLIFIMYKGVSSKYLELKDMQSEKLITALVFAVIATFLFAFGYGHIVPIITFVLCCVLFFVEGSQFPMLVYAVIIFVLSLLASFVWPKNNPNFDSIVSSVCIPVVFAFLIALKKRNNEKYSNAYDDSSLAQMYRYGPITFQVLLAAAVIFKSKNCEKGFEGLPAIATASSFLVTFLSLMYFFVNFVYMKKLYRDGVTNVERKSKITYYVLIVNILQCVISCVVNFHCNKAGAIWDPSFATILTFVMSQLAMFYVRGTTTKTKPPPPPPKSRQEWQKIVPPLSPPLSSSPIPPSPLSPPPQSPPPQSPQPQTNLDFKDEAITLVIPKEFFKCDTKANNHTITKPICDIIYNKLIQDDDIKNKLQEHKISDLYKIDKGKICEILYNTSGIVPEITFTNDEVTQMRNEFENGKHSNLTNDNTRIVAIIGYARDTNKLLRLTNKTKFNTNVVQGINNIFSDWTLNANNN